MSSAGDRRFSSWKSQSPAPSQVKLNNELCYKKVGVNHNLSQYSTCFRLSESAHRLVSLDIEAFFLLRMCISDTTTIKQAHICSLAQCPSSIIGLLGMWMTH